MINFTVMHALKKYAAILVLLITFPAVWFLGRAFITEYGTEIYEYIPQESDIVIEINNVNFISEFAYQRIFNEAYVLEKIDFEEVEGEIETGMNYFSKTVIFREQWADENVWIAIVGVQDEQLFTAYLNKKMQDAHVEFGDEHAIVQLSPSINQEQMSERLKQIAQKDITPFTSRVNLSEYFKADKEINCYFIPPSSGVENKIIDGYLTFDFHQDHVDIDGDFTTVGGFEGTPATAYALNENRAFSMRSSLNVFNSIYWFSKEKIENIPEYSQMAMDYDGVNLFMYDFKLGYEFPYKSFPDVEARFELEEKDVWHNFFDTLLATEKIRIDTTTNALITADGAFFKYNLDEEVFELYRDELDFELNDDENICFDLQFKIKDLIENTKFAYDEDNPPTSMLQTLGMGIAQGMVEDMKVLENIEQIRFQLLKQEDNNIKAVGKVQMENRDGQSVIESMIFAKESFYFVTSALETMSTMNLSDK